MQETINQEKLIERLKSRNLFTVRSTVQSMPPADLADLLNNAQDEELDVRRIFTLLHPEKAVHTFEFLDFNIQYELLKGLPMQQVGSILNRVSPDDRTALLERLPKETKKKWLSLLSDEERKVAKRLLRYPEDSIGRLMTPDYLVVKQDWPMSQVLTYIRKHGKEMETLNMLYVTDSQGVLIDELEIKQVLLAEPDRLIEELMDNQYVSLNARDDQEMAIKLFRSHDKFALPVTDFDGLLLGIVTIDDLLDVIEEEDTEDIHKLGGTEALDEPYLQIAFPKMIQKRGVWLIVLFLGEMLTATAMGYFEDEISKAVVLALFVPLIISSGGNTGSQSATLIIRAMALGEVSITDWWRIMRREIYSGLTLGFMLGFIGFLRIVVWSAFSDMYGEHWLLLAITVGLSLIGVVLWGTLSGSMLPLLLKRVGFDPATSSAPFVATLVDVTGLVIYFSISSVVLKGTLL